MPFSPHLIETHEVKNIPAGLYRDVKSYIQRLAIFYLKVNKYRADKLLTFGNFPKKDSSSFLFLISFGGDGAPGIGTIFNVSFLNVGKRILSSSETFMVFGGDVEENSLTVKRFVQKAIEDFIYLESRVFLVSVDNVDIKVEFKLAELPNDMKMLSFLAGELSNSAKYFTTFANVNSENYRDYNKSFGIDWTPFLYSKRVDDSIKVDKKKLELQTTKGSDATKRQKVTSFISNVLKSRQEEIPLVKHFVDTAKCEPLHLKNNVCKELFIKFWKVLFACNSFNGCKSYKDIPQNNIFYKFVSFLQKEMKLNILAKKMISWFNESSRGIDKDFQFRFRGQESNAFLKYFQALILHVLPSVEEVDLEGTYKERLNKYFKQLILLRKMISYSVRLIDFSLNELGDMIESGKELFKASCLSETNTTPSMWVLCNISPYHAKTTLSLYGFGLGVNSMEPREQKHQRLKKYAENTTVANKWPMIFRHEFLQLIFLREMGYDEVNYYRKSKKYLPDKTDNNCSNCGLPFINKSCPLCSQFVPTVF